MYSREQVLLTRLNELQNDILQQQNFIHQLQQQANIDYANLQAELENAKVLQELEQNRKESLDSLEQERQQIEYKLAQAWEVYNAAPTQKEARQQYKHIEDLKQQKREVEDSLTDLNATSETVETQVELNGDVVTPQIQQEQIRLQQLQDEYAIVYQQVSVPQQTIETPVYVPEVTEEQVPTVQSNQDVNGDDDDDDDDDDLVEVQEPVVTQPVYSQVRVSSVEEQPVYSQVRVSTVEEQPVYAQTRVATVSTPQPKPVPVKSQEDVNYFDAEHILAAKQKIREELGDDCDIPENCDLATLNQLTDDLYKNKQREAQAAKPVPVHADDHQNDAAQCLSLLAMSFRVKTTVELQLLVMYGQIFVVPVEKRQLEMQVLGVTQDKNGNVNLDFYHLQAERNAIYGQFANLTFFGIEQGPQSMQKQKGLDLAPFVEYAQLLRSK